jgi:hypothetical protein
MSEELKDLSRQGLAEHHGMTCMQMDAEENPLEAVK